MPTFTLPASLPWLFVVVAVFFLANTAIGLVAGYALVRLVRKPVWALPLDEGQTRHEVLGNVRFVAVAILVVTAVLASGLVRYGEETLARFALTFAALHFGFQAFYYALHRALHLRSLVRFHRYHHFSRVTTPLSGQSMSIVESFLWMVGYAGLPLLFSWVAPISLYGWTAYLAFNVIGNIVGHANVEPVRPWPLFRYQALLSPAFLYHALHHARWTGHYSFASAWADRLFGTEWSDWLALHERVFAGEPMTSLKQRGEDGALRSAGEGAPPA